MGWFVDSWHLLWGAGYWNTRKSLHLLGGRRGACPCQTPSDSGRAHETGCEAVHAYANPERFRVICPLLARGRQGAWVCSVDAAEVRPFWGRAALIGLGGITVLLLGGTLVAFAGLRNLGYEISYRQVAWPPAWREFRAVQSDYHLERARIARTEGRASDALLSLSSAYELNPANYTAGILLAQLWQTGQPMLSDRVYARLITDHPSLREQTAQAWYRALVARSDWKAAQQLAGERILHPVETQPSGAWIQAFLFAYQRLGETAALATLLASEGFPASLRGLFTFELNLAGASGPARSALMREAALAADDAFTAYYLGRRLLVAGDAATVLQLASASTIPLADRERLRLRLDGLAASGRNTERADLVLALLSRPTHPAVCELLGAHLVLYPNSELADRFLQKLRSEPLPPGDALYPQTLSLFLACASTGDEALLRAAATQVETVLGREFRALDLVVQAFLREDGRPRPETLLPILQPLPLDVAYALIERHTR